ncbi:MAG: 23S rRNA (uracil(1939)-C(5))-methyltransferase RlmD [Candidatus Cloacimonetes bacterium]|nr:23S rRNA (uracil(1939)-C(5))-methyltransferase RlmD [Candidatus Cloacimonadota bacterium]
MKYPSVLSDVQIEKLVYRGYGLAHAGNNTLFIPYSAPGDLLTVEINKARKQVLFGKIVKIKQASSSRGQYKCNVFTDCGGCDWLHIKYREQLHFKKEIISELFRGVFAAELPEVVSAGHHDHYRNKVFLPLQKDGDIYRIGMFARETHQVVPHDTCWLQPVLFNHLSQVFLEYMSAAKVSVYDEKSGQGNVRFLGMRYSEKTSELIIIIVTKNTKLPFTIILSELLRENFPNLRGIIQNINPQPVNTILGKEEKIIWGQDHYYEKIDTLRFRIHYRSFFQINVAVTESLYKYIRDNIEPGMKVIDAYCGTGTIGVFIADKASHVLGWENMTSAVEDARSNAALNGRTNCSFSVQDLEAKGNLSGIMKKNDVIILDPPRKGISRELLDQIIDSGIRRVIYASCDPATQLRDIKMFLQSGYHVIRMQAFDMFPHTYHMENVAVLERA